MVYAVCVILSLCVYGISEFDVSAHLKYSYVHYTDADKHYVCDEHFINRIVAVAI